MNSLLEFSWRSAEPFIERLGWVLVHSLWQFALAALLAGMVARALRRRSAPLRYGVLVSALGLVAAAPVITWSLQPGDGARRAASASVEEPDLASRPGPALVPAEGNAVVPDDAGRTNPGPALGAGSAKLGEPGSPLQPEAERAAAWSDQVRMALKPWLAWIVAFWIVGVLVCSLRPLLGWHTLRRLRRVGVSPAPDDVLAALRRVSERLGLRRAVRIMQSSLAHVPVLVGYLRPVILLPLSLATCMPPAQLEAVLAHELAHVRRHDFVINLLQTLVETIFFYHPAVWWLSRRIRVEREHCCDDFVVRLFDNRVEYGRALVAVEQLRGQRLVLALGASDGGLLSRVRRIVSVGGDRGSASLVDRWPAALLGLACLGAALALSIGWSLAAKDNPETKEGASPSATLPNGAKVELLGISFHQWQRDDWWRPDGTPLGHDPRDSSLKQVQFSSINAGAAQGECREFAVRVTGLPIQESFLAYQFCYEPYDSSPSRAVIYQPSEFVVTELPPYKQRNVRTVTLRIGMDESPEPIERSFGLDCKKRGLPPAAEAQRQADDLVQPLRVENVNGQAQLLLKVVRRGKGPVVVEWVPTAIDKAGKRHDSIQAGGRPGFFAYLYPVAPEQIDRFEYRLKLYRHWVTFENVSLQPGAKTSVKVQVESLPPEPAKLRIRNADGAPAQFNNVVKAHVGFPKASPAGWVESPTREGLLPLDKLPAGTHWLLAAGDAENRTLFQVKLPADQAILERRLGAIRGWTRKNIEIKPTVEIDAQGGMVIVVEIQNRTDEALQVSEEDVQLTSELRGEPVRGLSPRWHSGTFAQVKIEAGRSERLRLNWGDWVRRGVWSSRNHEPMAEPGFPPAEPGKIWVRVWLGNHGALPTSVTDPTLVLAQPERKAPAQPAPMPAYILPDHLNVMAVGFEPDGKSLVSVATEHDVAIRTWDLGPRKLKHEIKLADVKHANSFLDGHMLLSADRKRLVAIMENEVGIWETATGKLVKKLSLPIDRMQGFTVPGRGFIRGLTATPDFSLIACGYTPGGLAHDAYAVVWDVVSGKVVQTVQHADALQSTCVALSNDGKWLATGTQQAGTCVWDVSSGKRLLVLPNANPGVQHPDPKVSDIAANQILCLAFASDGKQLAIGDLLGVKLLDAKTGKEFQRIAAPFRFGRSGLVFSKNGQLLARVATDKVVPIWSARTGKLLAELPTEAHGGSFSDDGRWFAVGFTDAKNGVAVWRLSVGAADGNAKPSAQQQAAKNLFDLMDALRRYHDDPRHGRLPPPVIMGKDGEGKIPHSWRVEILPYLGQQALYNEYRFDEPWDSQGNRRLLARMPVVFRAPLDQRDSTHASYFAVVTPGLKPRADDSAGSDAVGALAIPNYHHGTVFSDPAGQRLQHIPDGTSNVVALVEARRDIPWTQPVDVPYVADKPLPKLGGWFTQGWHAAFADGKVKLLASDNDDITVRRLFTIGDGHNVRPKFIALPPGATAPPKGLEFLEAYPKLHGLSLGMTEQQFLEMAGKEKLAPRKTTGGGGTQYHIGTGDGHTVIVMFRDGEPRCTGIQRVRGEDLPERGGGAEPSAEDILSRKVSLTAKAMPLKVALNALARAAKVELQLDAMALKQVGLDIEKPVTATIKNEPLSDALGRVIDWEAHLGAFRELRGGKLVITTLQTRQAEIKRQLPEWLKAHYNRSLVANLDDGGDVVTITAGQAMTDELLGKLKTLPKLRELHVESTNQITPAGLQHLAELPSLHKLTLYSLRHNGNGLGDAAIQAVAGLKSLEELHVSECGTTDAGVRLLEAMPWLTHLGIRQEGRLTDAAIGSIAKLKRLKHLSLTSYVGSTELGWMKFSRDALRPLAELRDLEHLHVVGQDIAADTLQFPKLLSLSLGGAGVDDACAARIAACRRLQSLELMYTNITDDGLSKFAGLPELKRLDLNSHVVTDAGIEHLKKSPTMRHVSLRASRLTDESLRHLAAIPTLIRLDLHGSGQPGAIVGKRFTMAGVERLKALPNLRTLWLSNVHSDGGFLGLKELTQLRGLTLSMTNISELEVEALHEALPDTRISAMSGGGSLRLPRKNRFEKTAPQKLVPKNQP
ncbi:MAG: DUF1559 domain-containing protein [Gemmataceae bacterium]|nr:DUF1559 domain-containing protein [Gemmataceae bacterium]